MAHYDVQRLKAQEKELKQWGEILQQQSVKSQLEELISEMKIIKEEIDIVKRLLENKYEYK